MKIYATRAECEMLIDGLQEILCRMPEEDARNCERLMDRISEVCEKQCKKDTSSYRANSERR